MSLADDINELLTERGPMEMAEIRSALCCASYIRFNAAVLIALGEHLAERFTNGPLSCLRVPGDTREMRPIVGVYTKAVAAGGHASELTS